MENRFKFSKVQKLLGYSTTIISLILLVFYLIKSSELTNLGLFLGILSILLTLMFGYGIIKNSLKLTLFSSQVFLGIIFIFSGFVKAVDPLGSMYKIVDYLHSFNAEGLVSLSLLAAFILCIYEFPLGISIMFGAKGKLMTWLLLIIMIPFLFLTFYLALKNPVTDCGCFGDALILSNWETFLKNVIIVLFVGYLMTVRNQIKPVFKGWFGSWGIVLASLLFIFSISLYSKTYLPIMDFRPYKVGNDIQALMSVPEGETPEKIVSMMTYKNEETGEEISFSADDYDKFPSGDQWVYVGSESVTIPGYVPPIHDFRLEDSYGLNVTDSFLNQKGYRLMIVQGKISESNEKGQLKLNALTEQIKEENISFWPVTSSLPDEVAEFKERYGINYDYYTSDIIPLKTIIRSNPGLVLFHNNVVIKKWPARRIPDYKELKTYLK